MSTDNTTVQPHQSELLNRFHQTLEQLKEGLLTNDPSQEKQELLDKTLKTFQETVESLKGQTNQIEHKLKEFQRQFLTEHFSCEICGQVMYQPVTLFCQHTFCRVCLITYLKTQTTNNDTLNGLDQWDPHTKIKNKCPKCQRKFVLPPKQEQLNYNMEGAINDLCQLTADDPERVQRKKDAMKLDLMDQVKLELRQELLDTVLNESSLTNNPYQSTSVTYSFPNIPNDNNFGTIYTTNNTYPPLLNGGEWTDDDMRRWMMRMVIGLSAAAIVANVVRTCVDWRDLMNWK